ncbi:hypothetical protein [Streptomyces reticuli]|uniref:hypothetical protein n=1 Tax=Streptomyces reticuli TaxID=1926 RepID=UPI00073DD502|nr:hypothetical protein [Streptomyces sp. SID7810]CUW29650.1 hypothetical protein TUE45_04359 [Streptomyces reticuli]
MSQDPSVTVRLQGALELAVTLLALPLDAQQTRALALELSGPVRALLAEALATATDDAPVHYALAPVAVVDERAGVATTEYAGCTTRIATDVDHDSPAATLAAQLRRHHDVRVTDIPSGTYLGLTIRPRTATAWQWWLEKCAIPAESVTVQGSYAYAMGEVDGVAVHLCGEDTAVFVDDDVRARRGLDVDLDTPAGTVAAKVRRQSDVTGIEIRDAHTVIVTVGATSPVEWQWWLTQLSVPARSVTVEGTTALATGSKDGATVHLRGEGVGAFYEDQAVARLMGLIAPATP